MKTFNQGRTILLSGLGVLALSLAGCSGEPDGEESANSTQQALSHGCATEATNWSHVFYKDKTCNTVNGVGLHVNFIDAQYWNYRAAPEICGELHVWDNKGKLSLYGSHQCVIGKDPGAHTFNINRDLPDGDLVCVGFTGDLHPACETIHN